MFKGSLGEVMCETVMWALHHFQDNGNESWREICWQNIEHLVKKLVWMNKEGGMIGDEGPESACCAARRDDDMMTRTTRV